MPIIAITMGEATREQKKALIRELTAKAMEITELPAHAFIVTINTLPWDSIGTGGRSLEETRADHR